MRFFIHQFNGKWAVCDSKTPIGNNAIINYCDSKEESLRLVDEWEKALKVEFASINLKNNDAKQLTL
jgi:hypothetical protein